MSELEKKIIIKQFNDTYKTSSYKKKSPLPVMSQFKN